MGWVAVSVGAGTRDHGADHDSQNARTNCDPNVVVVVVMTVIIIAGITIVARMTGISRAIWIAIPPVAVGGIADT